VIAQVALSARSRRGDADRLRGDAAERLASRPAHRPDRAQTTGGMTVARDSLPAVTLPPGRYHVEREDRQRPGAADPRLHCGRGDAAIESGRAEVAALAESVDEPPGRRAAAPPARSRGPDEDAAIAAGDQRRDVGEDPRQREAPGQAR
jgi:hypothetical protein